MNKLLIFVVIFSFCNYIFCEEDNEESAYSRAVVESCPGCSLNRLPEVRKFIYEDIPKYEDVEFKKIQGHKPELVLLGDSDEELERIPLSDMTRAQCNELLTSKGFTLKPNQKLEL